ncbi:MAG: four helix bundle protein [Thiotrichales bacterium]|nr:four helix bundle protein [Thiotrichales bacterium]
MQADNAVLVLSYQFALHVVKLNQYLTTEKKEYVLSKQLLRSGTSIGANVNEAQAAISKKDFIAKMSIASKEARETGYWLNLLSDSEYIDRNSAKTQALFTEIDSLQKLLTSIVKTSQKTL